MCCYFAVTIDNCDVWFSVTCPTLHTVVKRLEGFTDPRALITGLQVNLKVRCQTARAAAFGNPGFFQSEEEQTAAALEAAAAASIQKELGPLPLDNSVVEIPLYGNMGVAIDMLEVLFSGMLFVLSLLVFSPCSVAFACSGATSSRNP